MKLLCPVCINTFLEKSCTNKGVQIDICPNCLGIWLDKGEIYSFTKKPKFILEELKSAYQKRIPGKKLSPISKKAMVKLKILDNKLEIDFCPHSKGIWLDGGESAYLFNYHSAQQISTISEGSISNKGGKSSKSSYSVDPIRKHQIRKSLSIELDEFKSEPSSPPSKARGLIPRKSVSGLTSLPSLFLRSWLTLLFLYTLIAIVFIVLGILGIIEQAAVLPSILAVIFIQFLLSPILLDLSLRWFNRLEWVNYQELPKSLRNFIKQTCKMKKIKCPKVGIINDGGANAFTYGHTPSNARLVITSGLFDLLDEDELNAVAAHEIGHMVHWDMLVMTIAQVVPVILYQSYRFLTDSSKESSSSSSKGKGNLIVIAIIIYVLYIISNYIILWLSRTREYWADRFAGEATGKPNSLASALVKIGYGIIADNKKGQNQPKPMDSIKALGIFDAEAAKGGMLLSQSLAQDDTHKASSTAIEAMKWDLWNPWAMYYELHSTHPLIAKRLQMLGEQAESTNQAPYVKFNLQQPESYWDEFLVDLFISYLPTITFITTIVAAFYLQNLHLILLSIALTGTANLIKLRFSHKSTFFPLMSISSLLKRVKVSKIRPIGVRLKGKVIGKGESGLIWSEDMILKDETGIIFLDYRQPLAIWEFLFGLFRGSKYQGKQIEIEGWYRRQTIPYIEVRKILSPASLATTCWVVGLRKFFTWIWIIAGIIVYVKFDLTPAKHPDVVTFLKKMAALDHPFFQFFFNYFK